MQTGSVLLLLPLSSVPGFPLYEDTADGRVAIHQLYSLAIEFGLAPMLGGSLGLQYNMNCYQSWLSMQCNGISHETCSKYEKKEIIYTKLVIIVNFSSEVYFLKFMHVSAKKKIPSTSLLWISWTKKTFHLNL